MKFGRLLPLFLLLSGCFVTPTLESEPPKTVREGKAPTLALIAFSKEAELVAPTRDGLGKCLAERNIFKLVDGKKLDKTIKNGNYDFGIYGLKDAEYQTIAKELNADYVMFGNVGVVKALKLTGWRKDIYSLFYLHDGKTGKKVDMWRSDTTLSTTNAEAELDVNQMLQSVINHTCSKIAKEF